jgi:FkbM family methyltransferase
MQKVGNWFVPDGKIMHGDMILEEKFTCAPSLEKAFKYVTQFNNAIDVGCWIGDSTSQMSDKFKNIQGFEASLEVYQCCLENLKNRNLLNCNIHNIGLSNQNGQVMFYNGKSNFSGWISSKTSFEETSITNKLIVEGKRLDDFNYQNIDFIKIDVDSHEGFLLDGARKFLKENSPVVLIEIKKTIHKDRQDNNMPDPASILEELGYTMVEKVAKWDYIFIKRSL